MADYQLTFQTVQIPTGSGGASVTIDEDADSSGTVDNSEVVSLSDGVTSYTTSSGAFAGTGQVRLSWSLGPPSDVTTTSATVVPASVIVDAQVPATPENLTVTQVTSTPDVTLSWGNVSNEDEYRIYRATSPGSTLGDYTQIDTVTVDTTTYTDSAVSLGTRYYYVVTAANTNGESPPSGEVRAEPNADDLTETISWDSEREWNYGTFSDTDTDGSGGLVFGPHPSHDFNYQWTIDTNVDALVEVRDASSGTVLASDSGTNGADGSGSFTIDTTTHPDLEFYVELDSGSSTQGGSISISDAATSQTLASLSNSSFIGTLSDTGTKTYTYAADGTYTTEEWDFTSVTTVTKFSYDVSIPSGHSITFELRDDTGTTQATINASAGANSTLVEVSADDRYSVRVILDNTTNSYTETPTVHSLTLETHTQPTGLALSNTTATSVDIDWTTVSVADSHELYRSETTPVTDGDTLVAETNTPPVTDSGLENGEQYYYSVRAEYTGE